jgi:HAD superfamily hydrolase (TIGR01509 family)
MWVNLGAAADDGLKVRDRNPEDAEHAEHAEGGGTAARTSEKMVGMKKFVLFDHDGVLVDTEEWYFRAGARALAEVGVHLDRDQYVRDMARGAGTWVQARAAGIDEPTLDKLRDSRDTYYQEYLRTKPIEIDGVIEVLEALSGRVRMAIVTTSKRADFELIHEGREIRQYMDFVLVRDDYTRAKPDPEPYLTALDRFGGAPDETLVVEDSSRGLRSAVAAGIDCVVVHNAFTASQDFTQARQRIRTLAELPGIVFEEA